MRTVVRTRMYEKEMDAVDRSRDLTSILFHADPCRGGTPVKIDM